MPKAFVMNPRRVEYVPPPSMPDGEYPGEWSGFAVEFFCEGRRYEATASDDNRGRNAPCVVTIKGGVWTVTCD